MREFDRFGLTLGAEVSSASRLMDTALEELGRYRPIHDTDPLFACLSLAMEKMLKLSIGVDELDKGRPWPSVREMTRTWNHNIRKMDYHVRGAIAAGVNSAANPPLVTEALEAIDSDPIIDPIVDAMDHYAVKGRFHNLDYLSRQKDSDKPSPTSLWMDVEQLAHTPELIAASASTTVFPTPLRVGVNARLAESINGWRSMIRVAWVQGVFGAKAKQLSTELRMAVGGV